MATQATTSATSSSNGSSSPRRAGGARTKGKIIINRTVEAVVDFVADERNGNSHEDPAAVGDGGPVAMMVSWACSRLVRVPQMVIHGIGG
jgi:hypothetical protein